MARRNPGPFEPLIYVLQTRGSFRTVGIGGLILFSVLFLAQAAGHGGIYIALGLLLAAVIWIESTLGICPRCRFYGTWHCLGQGMLVSKLVPRKRAGISDVRFGLHMGLMAAYCFYGLFWLWHSPTLGLLFTLWVVVATISASSPSGFSWRRPPQSSDASKP